MQEICCHAAIVLLNRQNIKRCCRDPRGWEPAMYPDDDHSTRKQHGAA